MASNGGLHDGGEGWSVIARGCGCVYVMERNRVEWVVEAGFW